ncbi:helix-turn-helix domain-containing protein [Stigmatella hybrida]|nr:helix-turn-helix transcriptional regulator [Stigmatella hybrida]
MTQAEAAEGIGIAPEVYGRMERGGRAAERSNAVPHVSDSRQRPP